MPTTTYRTTAKRTTAPPTSTCAAPIPLADGWTPAGDRPWRGPVPALLVLAMLMAVLLVPATAALADEGLEAEVLQLLQDERADHGQRRLATSAALTDVARRQARRMADADDLHHTPDLGAAVGGVLEQWVGAGENVGRGPDVVRVHHAFMDSPSHEQNLLAGRWTHTGVGVVEAHGQVWIVQVFAEVPADHRPAPAVQRLAGPDRAATAAEVSRVAYEPGSTNDVVVVDGGDAHAALAASAFAGQLDGPLLLTARAALDPSTAGAVDDALAGGGRAWVVGAVDEAVVRGLAALGADVVRVRSADAVATAAELARALPRRPTTAFVTTRGTVADALAAASVASVTGWPVLFTDPGRLSTGTADVLRELGVDDVVVVGGTAAVAEGVAEQLRSRGHDVRRVAGVDRVETALRVAELGLEHGLDLANPTIATGWNFPDALAGSTLTRARRGPMLLTAHGALPAATRAWLERHAAHVDLVTVLGGPSAVSDTVRAQLHQVLR